MQRKTLTFLMLFAFGFSAQFCIQSNVVRQNGIELLKQPEELPNLLPPKLNPPQAKLQWAALYASDPFFGAEEAVFIFDSTKALTLVERHYLKAFRRLSWQVLQHQRQGHGVLIIAESPFRRLLAVVLREGSNTSVKLYTRPVPLY